MHLDLPLKLDGGDCLAMADHAIDNCTLSYAEIHKSPWNMRCMMLDISKYCTITPRSQSWLGKMRFLVLEQAYSDSMAMTLNIKGRPVLHDPSQYVAISYCWSRGAEWFDRYQRPDVKVLQVDGQTRTSSAPSDVLYRTFAYAKDRNVNAIWIDQECIDQADPIDKENAIQAMDLVYQQSAYPIAVLESCFETQDQLDVFASVIDPGFFDFEPAQIEALEEILGTLVDDQWFTRAWTLQETTSAGVSMILLIGCPGLRKPEVFGKIDGELEVSIQDFQEGMVNVRNLIEEGLAADVWSDTSSAIAASNYADELWNRIPTNIPLKGGPRDKVAYRQQCSAAEAVTFLAERQNSVFPDRLAILANLCNYERRIDTKVLEQPNSSFSTCALTLAILNGDMSLLTGYSEGTGAQSEIDRRLGLPTVGDRRINGIRPQSDDNQVAQSRYGFSWGPPPYGRLSDITYREEAGAMFRLQPSSLSKAGLRVTGMLWRVERTVKVPKTQIEFKPRWHAELQTQVGELYASDAQVERQRHLMCDFTMCLLQEIIDGGRPDLAKTFWQFLQPLGRYKDFSSGAFLPQPKRHKFEEVFALHDSVIKSKDLCDQIDELQRQWSTMSLSVETNLKGFDQPSIQRKLIDQICHTGRINAGIPVPDSKTSTLGIEAQVWFDGAEAGDFIFTPYTSMGDDAALSVYQYEAISWHVVATDTVVEGCEVLHCLERRRGFWRFAELSTRDCILE